MFIVTTNLGGKAHRSIFGNLQTAKTHATSGRLKGASTTIHEIHAASIHEAVNLIKAGAAWLVEARDADPNVAVKQQRVAAKRKRDLLRELRAE